MGHFQSDVLLPQPVSIRSYQVHIWSYVHMHWLIDACIRTGMTSLFIHITTYHSFYRGGFIYLQLCFNTDIPVCNGDFHLSPEVISVTLGKLYSSYLVSAPIWCRPFIWLLFGAANCLAGSYLVPPLAAPIWLAAFFSATTHSPASPSPSD